MASIDPKIQSRLIRDLEPAVAVELEMPAEMMDEPGAKISTHAPKFE